MIRFTLLTLLALYSCQGPSEQHSALIENDDVKSIDSTMFYLNRVEKGMLSPKAYSRAAQHFLAQDSLIRSKAEYLMKAGLTCMNQEGEFRWYGVNYLILLSNKFPQHEYAPQALLQLALFFDNELGDDARASEFLRALVSRYPDDDLRDDAEGLLNLIDVSKSGEIDQVRQWLNKN